MPSAFQALWWRLPLTFCLFQKCKCLFTNANVLTSFCIYEAFTNFLQTSKRSHHAYIKCNFTVQYSFAGTTSFSFHPFERTGHAVCSSRLQYFHSAHPTGWAESISRIGLCMCVRPSSLRRWSLFLLVGFTDPYNHIFWKLMMKAIQKS